MKKAASGTVHAPEAVSSHWDVPTVHPVYFRLCMQALRSEGVDVAPLLVDAGLGSWAALIRRSDPLPYSAVHRVIQLILALGLRPNLPLEFGASIQVSAHGPIGLAVVSSQNLRQALQTLERYTTLRTANFKYRFMERSDGFSFELVDLIERQAISPERNFFYTMMFSLIVGMLKTVSGSQCKEIGARVPIPRPSWHDEFHRHFSGEMRFGTPSLMFCGPIDVLDSPCVTADSVAYAQACLECDRLMMQARNSKLRKQIYALLGSRSGDFPSLPDVAQFLNLSTRTLARRLTDEGTSFQGVLDEVRQQKAHWYLSETNLKMEDIALRLGYANLSSFSRVCMRWYGKYPTQLRMELANR